MQIMDLNPFLRSSTDINAFQPVLCAHYFPSFMRLPTPGHHIIITKMIVYAPSLRAETLN